MTKRPGARAKMARPLEDFELETWMRTTEPRARHFIGGSGMPRSPLRGVLPASADFWEQAWAAPVDEARHRVQRRLASAYGGRPEEFLLTQGASEADFVAAFGLAQPRERVVVEEPAYFALIQPARALGARIVRARRDGADRFRIPVDRATAELKRGARLVVLASPNNPTGALDAPEDLAEIAEACERADAYVVVDEVFAEATEAGDRPAHRLHPRILSVNSLTKCYGFGPLQLGWIHGSADVLETLRRAKGHVRPLNPSLDLAVAYEVLGHREEILKQTRRRRQENVSRVAEFMESQKFEWGGAGQGTTCVVRVPRGDDVALAQKLLDQDGVSVAPGSFVEMPSWIRLGLLSDPAALAHGLRVLEGAMRQGSGARRESRARTP